MKRSLMLGSALAVVALMGVTGIALAATDADDDVDALPVWVPPENEYMGKMSKATFIQRLAPVAIAQERETGLSRHFLIAQAAVESAWGRVTPGNMLFGRKWHRSLPLERRQLLRTWEETLSPNELQAFKTGQGGRVYIGPSARGGRPGHLVRDWFVRYDSWDHCIQEQVAFLLRRWPGAFGVAAELAADVVAGDRGGPRYATDSTYAKTLKRVIAQVRKLEPVT